MAKKKDKLTAAQRAQREWIRKLGPPPGFVRVTKKEFKAELTRRIDEIESSKVKTIPLDVAMRKIREELRASPWRPLSFTPTPGIVRVI